MDEYKNAVENLAFSKSDFIFKNSSPAHAAVVLSTMLKYSKRNFRIYDDNLDGDIADLEEDFYVNLNNFIVNSNGTLRVVIDSTSNEESRVYSTILSYRKDYPERVFVSKSNEEFKSGVKKIYNKPFHFALGDSKAFRLEEDTQINSTTGRNAFCSFNRPDVTSNFISAFDSQFESCEPII